MAADVQKALKMCIQCWRHNKEATKNVPLRSLPRGWPGKIIAMFLFGPWPKTKAENSFIPVFIDQFPKWVVWCPEHQ